MSYQDKMTSEDDPIQRCLEKARIGHPITKGEAIRALKRYEHVQHELDELQRHVDDPPVDPQTPPPKSTTQKLRESEEAIHKLKQEITRLKDSQTHKEYGSGRTLSSSPRHSSRSLSPRVRIRAGPGLPGHQSAPINTGGTTREVERGLTSPRKSGSVSSGSTRFSSHVSEDNRVKPNLLSVMARSGPYLMEVKTVVRGPPNVVTRSPKGSRKSTLPSAQSTSSAETTKKSDQPSSSERPLAVENSKTRAGVSEERVSLSEETPIRSSLKAGKARMRSASTEDNQRMIASATSRSSRATNTSAGSKTSTLLAAPKAEVSPANLSKTRPIGSPRNVRVRFAETQPNSAGSSSTPTASTHAKDTRQKDFMASRTHSGLKALPPKIDLSPTEANRLKTDQKTSQTPENTSHLQKTRSSRPSHGTEQESDLTLITDERKPMPLVETLGYIFNDEWRQAFDELTGNGVEEESTIRMLSDILKEAYRFCVDVASTQMEKLWRHQEHVLQTIIARPGHSQTTPPQTTDGQVILNREQVEETERYLRFYRQIMAGKSIPGLLQMFREKSFLDHIKEQKGMTSLPETLQGYTDAVLSCCWKMAVMDKPVKLTWLDVGVPVDKGRFSFYIVPGTTVKLTVWPAVSYGDSDTLLAKGVVIAQ